MKVLIAGASGLVGKHLTELLLSKGYTVAHLGRKKTRDERVKQFTWDPLKGNIESGAMEWAEVIVNLSGANVSEKRWSAERKKLIVESRTQSLRMLAKGAANEKIKPRVLITASGVGYYGSFTSEKIFTEKDPPGNDFFGECCKEWEASADLLEEVGMRCVKLRIGAVLARDGGALKKILPTVKFFIGSPLGSGKQWFPWIHIDDLCNAVLFSIENEKMNGAYNAVASQHVTNKEFMKALGRAAKRPVFFPAVPKFLLKLLLGEMAVIVLEGSRVSNEKLLKAGFEFKYDKIGKALTNLINGELRMEN
ncbi:MAG TPA: TIGR01777 family oxidoreductase [Bacteroidia bacterium]|jgi:uncharacterized protein (TIGR01777 family)|nr:TIGR01777 family oxidoreductase [Bacteroidia bacterium]